MILCNWIGSEKKLAIPQIERIVFHIDFGRGFELDEDRDLNLG